MIDTTLCYSLLPEHALPAVPVNAYSKTPTSSTNHHLLVAPTASIKTDNQDKTNVPHHGQAYNRPIQGYERGLRQRNGPHNGIERTATELGVDL